MIQAGSFCKIIIILAASLVQLVHSQGNCERITPEILGNTTHEEPAGLISELITPGGEGQASPPVRVKDFNIVCEAQAMTQFRYRYTSVVVSYTCTSVDLRLPQCDGSDTISQFDLGCNDNDQWTPNIFSNSMFVETAMPSATLSTTKESLCGVCANPAHPFFTARNATIELDTHCERCFNCTEGLMRCTNRGRLSGNCCNYFLQGVCVDSCVLLVFNEANECVCMELEDENGTFQGSDGEEIGSRANLTCKDGYQPEGSFTSVVCTTDGWSNEIAKCSPVNCGSLPEPENGGINITTFTFMSTATYTCHSGFVLEGNSTRTCMANAEWSGRAPTCSPCNSKIENCDQCVIEDSVICTRCANRSELIGLDQCRTTSTAGDCDIHCILGVVFATLAVLFIAGVAVLSAILIYLKLRSKHSAKSSNSIHNVAYGDLVSRTHGESNLSKNEDVDPAYDYPDNIINPAPSTYT